MSQVCDMIGEEMIDCNNSDRAATVGHIKYWVLYSNLGQMEVTLN
jgi:hypothetical protein